MVTWNKLKPNASLSAGQNLAVMVPFQAPRIGGKTLARKSAPASARNTAQRRPAIKTAKR